MVTEEEVKKLIEIAKNIRENAFVPRSDHKIGACILSEDGVYFGGCNTESIISGLGTCAERSAMDHAVSHGKYEFKALATYDDYLAFPCGCCLQYLLQFYQINERDVDVIVADTTGNIQKKSLLELLPHGYLTKHNLEKIKNYKNK